MSGITDTHKYVLDMRKSLEDKLFFIGKVGFPELFVDFGCADGSVIKKMAFYYPNCIYVAYDNNPAMIAEAKERLKDVKTAVFMSNMDELEKFVQESTVNNKVLLLSSVLHEVYNYLNKDEVERFWKFVLTSKFNYVVVRDMLCPQEQPLPPTYRDRIVNKTDLKLVEDFESQYGRIEGDINLLHFLLKYTYTDNWEHELKENYFSYKLDNILAVLKDNTMMYFERYTMPFIKMSIKLDYNINLSLPTHYKLIMKMKKV